MRFFRSSLLQKSAVINKISRIALCGILSFSCLLAPFPYHGSVPAKAAGGERALFLHFTHTGEEKKITFRRNGEYDTQGLKEINWLLRDWRRNEATNMDPQLFDLIWSVYQETGATKPIQVVSAFRSKTTNDSLRRRSSGVAKHSQHTLGKAMDFYIPGVPLRQLREIGLKMQVGGVGYYPTSNSPFVHMDTGNVRHWPRMTPTQLANLFPDGKTLHVSTEGVKQRRYAEALEEYRIRKAGVIQPLSKEKRILVASKNNERRRSGGILAGLFNKDDKKAPAEEPRIVVADIEEAEDTAPVTARKNSASAPIVIANKTVPIADTAPIPSRIARETPAPVSVALAPQPVVPAAAPAVVPAAAPVGVAAVLPPLPRALPEELRVPVVVAQPVLVANAPLPLLRPKNPLKPLDSIAPQIVIAKATLPEADHQPRIIDPTQTAGLNRQDFDVPTPVIVQNRLKAAETIKIAQIQPKVNNNQPSGAFNPTSLVLNEEPHKPAGAVDDVAVLAYADDNPVVRLPQIDANGFDQRFGKADRFNPSVPGGLAGNRRKATELTVAERFAALQIKSNEPAFSLKDLGLNTEEGGGALRKSLGLADDAAARTPSKQTAALPTPVASPRQRHLAHDNDTLSSSLTNDANRFEFSGEAKTLVSALMMGVSITKESHVNLSLPSPGLMPGLFISPTRAYAGSFSQDLSGQDADIFSGDTITLTPTVDFTSGKKVRLSLLAR